MLPPQMRDLETISTPRRNGKALDIRLDVSVHGVVLRIVTHCLPQLDQNFVIIKNARTSRRADTTESAALIY